MTAISIWSCCESSDSEALECGIMSIVHVCNGCAAEQLPLLIMIFVIDCLRYAAASFPLNKQDPYPQRCVAGGPSASSDSFRGRGKGKLKGVPSRIA